ncbi:hypothetical protein BG006_010222 [Podila minutissima]|uniref:Uncharacterized protein n=1 Tax=Podila minutissima TaxID=64525 RepID=A0A9P5VIC2_9FUNG|nr:hypothetical protein BG006_010222 [Podila minutissima]
MRAFTRLRPHWQRLGDRQCSRLGLNDITFPFNMANAPHKSGFFFAQEFSFNYVDNVRHTGLQPRKAKNGAGIVKAVFSSFIDGTTAIHHNCQSRADGGPGVICAVDVENDYSHTYSFTVKNAGSGTTWKGTLVDTETGYSTDVGESTLPEGAGKLVRGEGGFVDYLPWNEGSPRTCNLLHLRMSPSKTRLRKPLARVAEMF